MSLEAQLRARFVAIADPVAGVSNALSYEPAELGDLSAGAIVTMLGMPPAQEVTATGLDTVTYSWRVNVYVNLIQGYQEAQTALADVLEALLAAGRADDNANGLCDFWRLTGSGGVEPRFAHAEGYVYQELRLTAVIETP